MPEVKDVRVGAPDQGTTGAILSAPIGTPLPELTDITKAAVALTPAFKGNEYVSEDGLTLSPSMSTNDIKDWSGATVRKVLASFDGTLAWTMISTNEEEMKTTFGDKFVTAKEATESHGKQLKVALGAHLPDPKAFVFLMKDGDARMLITVPNGQITEVGDLVFKAGEAVGWPVTMSTAPDENGHSIYILTDDGQVLTDSES